MTNPVANRYAQPQPDHAWGSAPSIHDTEQEDLIDIRELLRVLWRRRAVILGSVFFITLLALIVTLQITPRYTASVSLSLQTRSEAIIDIQAVLSGLSADDRVIQSEIDVIRSRRLLGQLIERLNLVQDPEFNPWLREDKGLLVLLDPRIYLSPEWLAVFGLGSGSEPATEEELRALELTLVTDLVAGALNVSNPRLSYTIWISFTSESPRKAAAMANALADIYIDDQLEVKFEATERATAWLYTRVSDLRERVRNAENAVQEFREQHSIIESGAAGTISEQQLTELNIELVNARTKLAEAQARFSQVRARGQASAAALGEVLQSPLIQRLGEQEAQIRRQVAELSERYGPRHPDVINIRSQLRDIQSKIEEETTKITQSVETEVSVARARVNALSENLELLKSEQTELEQSRIQLRELEREAQSSQILLETFMSRFQETSSQEDIQQADARVISEATVPINPSYPRKSLILAAAFVLSAMVGFGLAFLLEALDNGYRGLSQIEKALGIKGLGMIPKLGALTLKGDSADQYVLKKPTSAYGEALRAIHTSLALSFGSGNAPKRLLVTSSLPGEGKSTFSISLARLLARAGNMRVLLIDADFRRGNIKQALLGKREIEPGNSLITFLGGESPSWQSSVLTDEASGLHLLLSPEKVEHPQTLLQSENMLRLLAEAPNHYDLVILDAPPLLAVADALILAHQVDSSIFIVKWESTPREAVKNAISLLRKTHAPEGGVVLSQVNIKKHAYYGYGDYASYYGRYGNYYTG